MSERQETIDDIIAEARDKYTVHECNQCAWRKCCSKGFGSEECGKRRESIWLKLGIEDGYYTQLLNRLDAAHKREHNRNFHRFATAEEAVVAWNEYEAKNVGVRLCKGCPFDLGDDCARGGICTIGWLYAEAQEGGAE